MTLLRTTGERPAVNRVWFRHQLLSNSFIVLHLLYGVVNGDHVIGRSAT